MAGENSLYYGHWNVIEAGKHIGRPESRLAKPVG